MNAKGSDVPMTVENDILSFIDSHSSSFSDALSSFSEIEVSHDFSEEDIKPSELTNEHAINNFDFTDELPT